MLRLALVRMCSNIEELVAVTEISSAGARLSPPGSGTYFKALLWAALEADAGPLAARVVVRWLATAGTAPVLAWCASQIVLPAAEVICALLEQADQERSRRSGGVSFLRGLLPRRSRVGSVSGALLGRVRAGQHTFLGQDGALRDAACEALAELPEAELLLDAARSTPPLLRAHAARAVAPALARILLRRQGGASPAQSTALAEEHAQYIRRIVDSGVPPSSDASPEKPAGPASPTVNTVVEPHADSVLALTIADVAAGRAPPANLLALVHGRRYNASSAERAAGSPISVVQCCDVLAALLDAPGGTDVTACSDAFCACVDSRPAGFAADAEVALLLLAISAAGPHAVRHASVLHALRVAAASPAAVGTGSGGGRDDSGYGAAPASASLGLGSAVGDVSLQLLLQRRHADAQVSVAPAASTWWLSPTVAAFPPLFDVSLQPPSYLQELSSDDDGRRSVEWFDELGHAPSGSAGIESTMLLRSRLRQRGAFLTGYFAEEVDAFGARPDNVFALARVPTAGAAAARATRLQGCLSDWASAGPAACAYLQVVVGLLRAPPPVDALGDLQVPTSLPGCVQTALPLLIEALIAASLAPPPEPPAGVSAPAVFAPIGTAAAALALARAAELSAGAGARSFTAVTPDGLGLAAAALLLLPVPPRPEAAPLPPPLRAWLAIRALDAGVALPTGAAAQAARLCADAAVAQQFDDTSPHADPSARRDLSRHGEDKSGSAPAALEAAPITMPVTIVHAAAAAETVTGRLLPPGPTRVALVQVRRARVGRRRASAL